MNVRPVRAFIGLGSNLGDPHAQLERALAALAGLPGTVLREVSSTYRTAPWGDTDQPDFFNAVAAIDTMLSPEDLLGALRGIEATAGRRRDRRWGPRTLDLDLLLYGEVMRDTPDLQLPHPRMHQRAFVLVPLAELAPALVLGEHGSVTEALARIGSAGVHRLDSE
ncbi:2-amino-4-hydroxy-6-hydroxymethyldihydropteridine diphosphokinase [Xanthomonadaceae bacterium JHOS43]|nr:2-amino-4-hydroxy-6-hydroxymethyldihydropteridine diphosphokinase [Xanthomonadaceae bacterium JHOS43]MCX7562594.1 2-amino-4-hydroxy-6-hydroxymethyldihydropteridine diphosphokinase [Xanthomonadaceae bacterium XH05]